MPWYLWMLLGVVVYVGVSYYLTESLIALKPKPPETCSWCTSTSGHTVTGHSYATCRGSAAAQRAEEQRRGDLKFEKERRTEAAQQRAAHEEAERVRQAGKLRMLQIGTITTRTASRRNEIHITGWGFDALSGPYSGPSGGAFEPYTGTGAPERTCGWTVHELHAIAHGGACHCDVARLAQR
ncbi:hypothetical protein AB0E08_08820 [Streptomyces sp. NPDC048281]|uniref:hypothetical protein n=1 Tax=Streptomyces sp. NPDC048281 TaxID=3154715 RepID=UPI00343B7D75